ncbi:hypothetical protein FACS1894147_06820 [Spirochaetia bacterium]|nr:hypothetical protein FACS1894147_06820 [Spirochaetia bacterium]
MKTNKIYVFLLGIVLASCTTSAGRLGNSPNTNYCVTECPEEIRQAALSYAGRYAERETRWDWGGRDYLDKKGVLTLDCSGFIVRIFQYAVKNSGYALLFEDAPLSAFHEYFTVPINALTPGDIIFMGTLTNAPPTHMSIFVKEEDGDIYFMDATQKEEEGIDGVSLRHYSKNDPRFLYYARLLVKF